MSMLDSRNIDKNDATTANPESLSDDLKEISHKLDVLFFDNQNRLEQKSNIDNKSDLFPPIKVTFLKLLFIEKIIIFCGIGIFIASLISLIIFSKNLAFYVISIISTFILSISLFRLKKYKKIIRRSTN